MYPKEFPTATTHNYDDMNEKGYLVCSVCGHSVKRDAGGVCIGVPIITNWDNIPEGTATKTTLYKEYGLKVGKDQQPVAAKKVYDRKGKPTGDYYPLYDIEEATPKKKATQAQLGALAKARHMAEKITVLCSKCGNPIDKGRYSYLKVTRKKYEEKNYKDYICEHCEAELEAMQEATEVLESNTLILDTETTDLDGEIIEIAIINMQGETLFNQRIKPLGEMSAGAYAVHHISIEDLQDEPTFKEIYPQLKELLEGQTVAIYNADFDTNILYQDCRRSGLEPIKFNDVCIMKMYSEYVGQWSDYHQSYRWQPLTGGDHSALGDCLATLKVIQNMSLSHVQD